MYNNPANHRYIPQEKINGVTITTNNSCVAYFDILGMGAKLKNNHRQTARSLVDNMPTILNITVILFIIYLPSI